MEYVTLSNGVEMPKLGYGDIRLTMTCTARGVRWKRPTPRERSVP
ncbi:MAG: hypothetical protein QM302_05240 [Acidobacteriota bacterium]|nr:hypothetical protein [Acidobacteriota bacterium]